MCRGKLVGRQRAAADRRQWKALPALLWRAFNEEDARSCRALPQGRDGAVLRRGLKLLRDGETGKFNHDETSSWSLAFDGHNAARSDDVFATEVRDNR